MFPSFSFVSPQDVYKTSVFSISAIYFLELELNQIKAIQILHLNSIQPYAASAGEFI